MPLFKVYEFALVSLDGEPQPLSTAGRFRITEEGDSARMEVKPCDKEEWVEPTPQDLEIFKRVLKRYS